PSVRTPRPEGAPLRTAPFRSCGIEPSKIRPISSMRPPPSLPAPCRLRGGLGLLLQPPEQPLALRVERAHLALELGATLLGQRGLQAQVLRFLVDARQLPPEAGGVAPAARPLDPQHGPENDEGHARRDEGPGAAGGLVLHDHPCFRSP